MSYKCNCHINKCHINVIVDGQEEDVIAFPPKLDALVVGLVFVTVQGHGNGNYFIYKFISRLKMLTLDGNK